MKISAGMIVKNTCDESPLKGLHRVIQVFPDDDEVVLIEVPMGGRNDADGKAKSYYAKGFFILSISELSSWIDMRLVYETKLAWPSLWNLSDDEIRELYPPRAGNPDASTLLARDRKWAIIRTMLPTHAFVEAAQYKQLQKSANRRAGEAKVSKGQILDALHRYYAFGCIKNALLLNTVDCGAPDQPRIARNGRKLGRKNASAAVGNVDLQGKILTEEDRRNLQDGWAMFVRPGTTVGEAYLATTSAFYSSGYTLKHGVLVPDLLTALLRPTEREFRYHGPLGQAEESASRRLMGEGEWLKNHRELNGSARAGVLAFGQLGSIDASPIDVNLVACFDRVRPIGVGRGIFVTDVHLGLILGWHVAIGGVSTDDANMAILNAALDKRAMLERYGLTELSADDFPAAFFIKILSDNGELRSIKGIESSVEKLGGTIEFIPSGRADRNSPSESGHHVRHRSLDHHLPGTTRGRQRKRGEELPITKALLTHYEYCRLLIQWIHWRNTKQEVPHLLTTEMRRDNVKPTRIDILRWSKKEGYVAGKMIDTTYLRAHLLPTFKASIKRNGLVLHRPNTGEAVELLRQAIFSDPYLAASGMIRSALNGGKKHVEVRADPDDLSCVYLFDSKGVHLIPNISDDLILVQEGSIADLGVMNDIDRERKVESSSERDQNNVDMRSYRVETVAEAKRSRINSQKEGGTVPSVKSDRSSVRENQRREKRAQLDASIERLNTSSDEKAVKPAVSTMIIQSQVVDETSVADQTMGSLMQQKLKNFHQRRAS